LGANAGRFEQGHGDVVGDASGAVCGNTVQRDAPISHNGSLPRPSRAVHRQHL